MKMNDEDPDYAALTIAGMVFGGSPELAAVPAHSREGWIELRRLRPDSPCRPRMTAAGSPVRPSRRRRTCRKWRLTFNEELARALKDGFTADEVEKAKKTWLDERTVARAEEASIGSLLMASRALGPHAGCGTRSWRQRWPR